MNKPFYSDFTLGILGGGQLGRMLIQEAIDFNVHTHTLDPDPNAPCLHLCNSFTNGSLQDYETVYQFGKKADLVTIEFENVNVDALQTLEDEGIPVYPQPRVLRIIQDKGLQKLFYQENNIPTADFILVNSKTEIGRQASFLPCFQKARKAGYDGKGVQKLRSADDIEKAFDEPSVLEQFIDFEKEISVIVARSASGEINHFPPVEQEFNAEANLVEFLFSPAMISKDIEEKAIATARQVAEKLQIIGILAVELFLTKDGQVLVNEVAPRPHNSGHHTIEANLVSQYEQHLRAILNMPLGATTIKMPAVMVNLLGEKGFEGRAKYEGLDKVLKMEGVSIHLYGKKFTKPFRKMGHVTILAPDLASAREKAHLVQQTLKVIA